MVYILKTLTEKTQLNDLFLKMQDQTNSTLGSLMAEMKDLDSSFKRLESDVQVVKTVNNNLPKQLKNTQGSAGQLLNIRSVSVWRLVAYLKQWSQRI